MRILQISSGTSFGGGERHVADLCQELMARDHELHLVTRPNSALADYLKKTDISIHTLRLAGAIDLFSAYQLAKLIIKLDIELIHAHYARDYPLVALAVKLARRKRTNGQLLPAFFITRHHFLPIKGNAVYRYLLKELDYFITVSESVRQTVAQSFQWPLHAHITPLSPPETMPTIPHSKIDGPAKPSLPLIVTIPNWIDITSFSLSDSKLALAPDLVKQPLRKQWHLPIERPVIGLINQIAPLKGQDLLIEAVSILKQRGLEIVALLAGREHESGSPYTQSLKTQATNLGIASQIVFTGHLTKVSEFYQAVDMVVIPSENEAFSIVCLEAMAMHRPVIATDVGGLAELINDGETGLLLKQRDSERLVEQILRLLTDKELVGRLTSNAYQMLKDKFEKSKVIDRIETLYKQAVAKRSS